MPCRIQSSQEGRWRGSDIGQNLQPTLAPPVPTLIESGASFLAGLSEPPGVPEAVVGQATLGIGGEVRLDAIEEIHVERVHMLDLNPIARPGLEPGGDLVERAPGHVYAAWLAGSLQALREIGRVAPHVVGEAARADDAGHQRARTDPNAQLPERKM